MASIILPRIISVHVPKTGGTTLLKIWRDAAGWRNVLADYEDVQLAPKPIAVWLRNRPRAMRADVKVVHGHFHASKYDLLEPKPFRCTFLRHPVDAAASAYWHIMSSPANAPVRKVGFSQSILKEKLTLVQALERGYLRQAMVEYFTGWDMARMDFVGCYERRGADLVRLSAATGYMLNRPAVWERRMPATWAQERKRVVEENRAKLEDLLKEEILFYERWAKP